ncbi:RdgB/HAM1 family non-canonical purine NTP pyrophosphatase [Spirulina sp. CS-785/01]|uniref:RdgB/HAM1 family non-canonical purine NTP pyrophosphatase n=1 Tax=Spirulina sp. CS-785/01 TaxID=3021716 RepID=UPI003FA736D1
MTKLIVATSNAGKVREMEGYLQGVGVELHLKPPELEIEETGATFQENAELKASQVAKALGEWAIADDSGLSVRALDGAPGLFSARYGATDQERIQRLLNELGDSTDRTAEFICAIAISRPNGQIALTTQGICPGEILHAPRGTGGFGYDPIFYVPDSHLTFAEMTPQQKDKISHRGRAFQQLLPQWPKLG